MPPETEPQEVTPSPVPTFQFRRYSVLRVIFEVNEPETKLENEPRPNQIATELSFGVQLSTRNDAAQAEVALTAYISPDQKWQPYKIVVTVSGLFTGAQVTRDAFDKFLKLNAPVILFPYIRELVYRTTADGPFGVVRLDPVNMHQLLSQSEWTTTDASSEPPPPSEQSTSASPESKT